MSRRNAAIKGPNTSIIRVSEGTSNTSEMILEPSEQAKEANRTTAFGLHGFAEVLHLPFRCRMRRHIRMQNPTASHFRWITLAQITTRT